MMLAKSSANRLSSPGGHPLREVRSSGWRAARSGAMPRPPSPKRKDLRTSSGASPSGSRVPAAASSVRVQGAASVGLEVLDEVGEDQGTARPVDSGPSATGYRGPAASPEVGRPAPRAWAAELTLAHPGSGQRLRLEGGTTLYEPWGCVAVEAAE